MEGLCFCLIMSCKHEIIRYCVRTFLSLRPFPIFTLNLWKNYYASISVSFHKVYLYLLDTIVPEEFMFFSSLLQYILGMKGFHCAVWRGSMKIELGLLHYKISHGVTLLKEKFSSILYIFVAMYFVAVDILKLFLETKFNISNHLGFSTNCFREISWFFLSCCQFTY